MKSFDSSIIALSTFNILIFPKEYASDVLSNKDTIHAFYKAFINNINISDSLQKLWPE